jgi:hypothetical protein
MLEQIVSGIHTRLYARAYIVADPSQDRCVIISFFFPLVRRHSAAHSRVVLPLLDHNLVLLQQSLCVCQPGRMHGVSSSHLGCH